MQNFGSASLTSINNTDNVNCEYQNFILQQKHLMQKIHSQEKKLKHYHTKQSTHCNPNLVSGSFLKRTNSYNSKYDRPECRSSSAYGSGFDKLRNTMQTMSTLCAPMPLHSAALPSPSKHFKSTNTGNDFNRHIKFLNYKY